MLALGKKLTNKYIVLVFYRFNDFSFFLLFYSQTFKKERKKKRKVVIGQRNYSERKTKISQSAIHSFTIHLNAYSTFCAYLLLK